MGKEREKRKTGNFGLQLLATARVRRILVDENNYVMTGKKKEIRMLMERVVSIVCHLLPSLFLVVPRTDDTCEIFGSITCNVNDMCCRKMRAVRSRE